MRLRNGEPVTWHRYTEGFTDVYGRAEAGYEDTVVPRVGVAMSQVQEPAGDGMFRVVETADIYGPADMAPDPRDEFTVRGERYAVVSGSALNVWRHPGTGRTPGAVVSVRRVTG